MSAIPDQLCEAHGFALAEVGDESCEHRDGTAVVDDLELQRPVV
jgi:hypothetical protein